MHWTKIVVLVLLTVAAMRLGSWILGWVLAKLFRNHHKTTSILSNLVAFSVFVLLLYKDLMPGEPMDWAVVVFGLVMYTMFTVTDLFWTPGSWLAHKRQ
jgi:hypothetical protein